MPSHGMKSCTIYGLTALLLFAQTAVANVSGPGSGVYEAILTLWKHAPEKFDPVLTPADWAAAEKQSPYVSGRYSKFDIEFDIPEFEEEHARLVQLSGQETDYVVSAKKHFPSDQACLAYYRAMLKRLPELLAGDDVRISDRDDHIFYKDRQDTYYRKIYVKHYLKKKDDDRPPRVIVSVRVEFPGQ